MHRLYQWLSQRASLFRSETSREGGDRSVRTEVTIEQQETTWLMCSGDLDTCPFCGQKLSAEQAEQARLRLQRDSTARALLPADRNPP